MRWRRSGGVWLIGAMLSIQTFAPDDRAWGQVRFRAGMKDVSLGGGYSVSVNLGHTDTVDGVHLLPHFGYILTDEVGARWARGNLELLAEPTFIHLKGRDESATVVGVAALGRWILATGPWIRPYLEAGVGVLAGEAKLRHTNCDVNFVLQGGPGVLVFVSDATAVTVGYRLHHISNAEMCSKNVGLNSSLFILGVSYFFP